MPNRKARNTCRLAYPLYAEILRIAACVIEALGASDLIVDKHFDDRAVDIEMKFQMLALSTGYGEWAGIDPYLFRVVRVVFDH